VEDYFGAGMRLYVDRIVDWEALLTLRSGEGLDVEAEVGAYRTILETCAALAADFAKPARENWSAEAERTPDGGAQPPAHMRDAYAKLKEAGLVSLPVSEEYGGYGVPALLNGLVLEMVGRSDPSLMMVIGLQTGVANDIGKYGSDEVKRTYLPRFVSGDVQGSMDLTEPQAGSDLGGIVARATDLPNGDVQVDGQKIFISNGGAEIHLVLARDDDSFDQSRGTTNGLSLILVPWHREDGSRNGVSVSRLEKKLGIHGSPTCEVIFEGAIGKRLADSLIMTIYEGTSEIQASFALKEMGKGALGVVLNEVRAELDAVADDPVLGPPHRRRRERALRARCAHPRGRDAGFRLTPTAAPGDGTSTAVISPSWRARRTEPPTPIDPSSSSATGCPSHSVERRPASNGPRPPAAWSPRSSRSCASRAEPGSAGREWTCPKTSRFPPTASPTASARSSSARARSRVTTTASPTARCGRSCTRWPPGRDSTPRSGRPTRR
jgi:hypothetical protein